jgi:hypothetical protein
MSVHGSTPLSPYSAFRMGVEWCVRGWGSAHFERGLNLWTCVQRALCASWMLLPIDWADTVVCNLLGSSIHFVERLQEAGRKNGGNEDGMLPADLSWLFGGRLGK